MRAWPRMRKTVKWGGLALTAVLLLLWAGSAWKAVYIDAGPLSRMRLEGGSYIWIGGAAWSSTRESYAFGIGSAPSFWRWKLGWFDDLSHHGRVVLVWESLPRSLVVVIIAWLPPLLTAIPTAAAWWLDARARRQTRVHRCAKCGYDRAGLPPAAPCPECNTPAPTPGPGSK